MKNYILCRILSSFNPHHRLGPKIKPEKVTTRFKFGGASVSSRLWSLSHLRVVHVMRCTSSTGGCLGHLPECCAVDFGQGPWSGLPGMVDNVTDFGRKYHSLL